MSNRGINKVILIGHLGQEPEVRYMPNGNAVTKITLATSENWKDKQTGEVKEKTEWHRVVLFGKQAEIAGEYLHKGSQVYIEGSLQTRKWKDQTNGQDRYITEVIVNIGGNMQMIGNRQNSIVNDSDRNLISVATNLKKKDMNKMNSAMSLNKMENKHSSSIRHSVKNDSSKSINESIIDFDDDIPF